MSDHLKPQPQPSIGSATPSWSGVVSMWQTQMARSFLPDVIRTFEALIEDGLVRAEVGVKKYGLHHQHDNGRDHAADAYQEALDGCCYWYAEWQKTGSREAAALFADADTLAFKARAYLLKRDGK